MYTNVSRTPNDLLKETLVEAEQSASNMEIDEIAFLLGLFDWNWDYILEDCDVPKVKKLLKEMQPMPGPQALLTCSRQRNGEGFVARVADLLIRCNCR